MPPTDASASEFRRFRAERAAESSRNDTEFAVPEAKAPTTPYKPLCTTNPYLNPSPKPETAGSEDDLAAPAREAKALAQEP